MEVKFWCMRHGEKDAEGRVTERGLRQVATSAVLHLTDMPFDLIVNSGLPRARDSAMRVRNTLGLDCVILEFPAFGYEPGSTDGVAIARKLIGKPHAETTVSDWLSNWGWPSGLLRGNMRAAMLQVLLYLKTNKVMRDLVDADSTIDVLVVGHSPGLEMAADLQTGSLNEADIITYEVEIDETGFTHLRSGQILRCPAIE